MQIRLPDGTRPPYRSTRTKNKKDALKKAQEWDVRARKEQEARNKKSGQAFLRVIMDAESLADKNQLSATKAEELVRRIYALANPDANPVSLEGYWKEYIKRERPPLKDNGNKSSWEINMNAAQKLWCSALGKHATAPLAKLSLDHLQEKDTIKTVTKGLRGNGIKNTTYNLYRTLLIQVIDDAVARKLLDSNPSKGVKTADQIKENKPEKDHPKGVFTPNELLALLDAADDEWVGMILCGFYTGLRMMDIASLSTEDLEGEFIIKTSGKTKMETDTPVHPRLKAWIGDRKGSLFPKQRKQTNACLSERFAAVMKKAKVEKLTTIRKRTYKRRFHELRHTFNSILANEGTTEDVRMALSGSSDAKVHSRYVHTSDHKLMEAIAAMPDLELDPEFDSQRGGAA